MEETKTKRKRPNFVRKDWHKRIKLGRTVKKKRKWKKAYGIHNKIRLGRKGQSARAKIGYSEHGFLKNKIDGLIPIRVENLAQLECVEKKGFGVIIASVGARKKKVLIDKANEMKLVILNKYIEKPVKETKEAKK